MSTHGQFNTKSPTIKRILREAAELSSSTSTDYTASPLDSNLFEWHFTIRGPPPPSPFSSGLYHGRIVLPPTYPLRPPSFRFLTPSGRFEPNREICLSISGHHEESWQPAWGIRTALVAIRSFMDTEAKGQVGGVEASKEVRKGFAAESRKWRCAGHCSTGGETLDEVMRKREEEVGEGKEKDDEEEKVPEELRLGYRDEMEKAAAAAKGTGVEMQMDGSSIASLDGTLPVLDGSTSPVFSALTSTTSRASQLPSPSLDPSTQLPPTAPSSSQSLQPPRTPSSPRHQAHTHTRTHNTAQASPQAQRLRQTPATASNWLDLAIVGIAAALGALIIRKVLTF